MNIGINGAVVEAGKAVISVYDHGFLYGMGLFETFRTYGGKPYLLDRHLDRLVRGCEELGIRYTPDRARLEQWLRRVMASNGLEEAYVRLTITAGEEGLGLPAGDYERPNELLLVKPLPPVDPLQDVRGKELRLLRTRRNTPEGSVRHKSLHYMNSLLAKRELMRSGAAANTEGLMLTADGLLAEGIVSNLFFASGRKICTPSTDTGILPGITRGRVLELAEEAGYDVEEGHYRYDELLDADEIWITNSVQELVPVTRLTSCDASPHIVGNGTAGPIATALLKLYRQDASGER